ncbi:MAG: hypothetical protein ACW967_10915 [Candidatus Hodarchaeales archaeon]|jgi:Na+-driven multidrug efflux pump
MNIESNWMKFTIIAIGVVFVLVFVNLDNLFEFLSDNDPVTLLGVLILLVMIFSAPFISRFRNLTKKSEKED